MRFPHLHLPVLLACLAAAGCATAPPLTGDHPENPTFALPCREVFARGQRRIEVTGPCLEDEAAEPHRGFWHRP